MMTDIEIAQSVTPKHILDIAKDAGIDEKYIEHMLTLRRPDGKISTPRKEKDEFRNLISDIDDEKLKQEVFVLLNKPSRTPEEKELLICFSLKCFLFVMK